MRRFNKIKMYALGGINDQNINNVKVRFQKIFDLPPKDLRKIIDNGKKEIGEGIVVVFAIKDDKIGLAIGVTEKLVNKFDAVKLSAPPQ